jgi:hypothetical protein
MALRITREGQRSALMEQRAEPDLVDRDIELKLFAHGGLRKKRSL